MVDVVVVVGLLMIVPDCRLSCCAYGLFVGAWPLSLQDLHRPFSLCLSAAHLLKSQISVFRSFRGPPLLVSPGHLLESQLLIFRGPPLPLHQSSLHKLVLPFFSSESSTPGSVSRLAPTQRSSLCSGVSEALSRLALSQDRRLLKHSSLYSGVSEALSRSLLQLSLSSRSITDHDCLRPRVCVILKSRLN